jgi:hypothetical protein
VDTDETKLTTQAKPIEALRKQLESLRPPLELTESEKTRVIAAVTSIADPTLADEPAIWRLHWKAVEHAETKILGKSTYYFRACWDDNRRHHSQSDIDADEELTIRPDP